MTIVIMRQMTKNRWRIESLTGTVISDDIILNSTYEAKEFITNFVSSFNWDFEIKPLGDI